MDIEKLNQALKVVHEYIVEHNSTSSTVLETEAKQLVKTWYPGIGNFSINVAYSDDVRKKLFYLDLTDSKQILIYSGILNQAFDLTRLTGVKKYSLAPCQIRLLDLLDPEPRRLAETLVNGDIKNDMRRIVAIIASYQPEKPAAKQLIREILEDCYASVMVG